MLIASSASRCGIDFLLSLSQKARRATLLAGLKYENEMNSLCFAAGDHMEGIRAFSRSEMRISKNDDRRCRDCHPPRSRFP
jgi:hypothetical protein